jgi:riboflavin synthase
MFTGIIEELGTIRSVTPNGGGARLEIACATVLDDAVLGASIAVNGCCLTLVERGDGWWATDAQVETLERTSLGSLVPGDSVNLERPLCLADRIGGHIVQGHVDGVGRVSLRDTLDDGSTLMRIAAPASVGRYIVEKGSITVDGVSLTVTTVDGSADADATFGVALIPHTLAMTTLGVRDIGDIVNLEVDLIAKYVERLIPSNGSAARSRPGATQSQS